VFQRAEASTFWGREIGLMYMHAHLRYAEALARVGDGDALLTALAKASPVGLESLVPQARPRQTTCYYSSSDGAFTDRYDASERYAALMAGDVPLEGGWRVYSSGPGLVLRLVTEVLLGIRQRGDDVEIDPVLPPGGDGGGRELAAHLPLAGHDLAVRYVLGPEGHGVRRVTVDGRELDLRPLSNPYRRAGVAVRLTDLLGSPAGAERPTTTEICVETH
jgi:cellobiose phosphorylase